MERHRVDLPHPDGPVSVMNSLVPILRSMSFRTGSLEPENLNDTSLMSMMCEHLLIYLDLGNLLHPVLALVLPGYETQLSILLDEDEGVVIQDIGVIESSLIAI